MKDQINKVRQVILIFIMAFTLQACGGSSDNTPNYTISADVNNIVFGTEFRQVSDTTIAINVSFNGDGLLVGFPPDVSPVPWLKYRTETVTENSATIYLDIINAQFFIPQLYETKIRLSTGNETTFNFVHHDIDVSLLIWQLTTNTNLVSFRGTFGDSEIAPQTFEITSESNTWTAAADVSWLSLDVTSGTGNGVITITPTITDFTAAGLQQANIILTETTTNTTKTLPVELGLDNIYLFADQANIAFSATKNIQAVEKTITIATNKISDVLWQATTEATWLTLQPIDGTNQLKITADPSIVPDNTTSAATILISATDDNTVIGETISINLYRSDLMVENNKVDELIVNNNTVIAAPTLPHIYVGIDNELRIYHQYTAELVTSLIISPENTLLDQFVVHPNGELLLARAIETIDNADGTTETIVHRYNINLTDYTFIEIEDADILREPVTFARFDGRYFVVTQLLEFADENLTRLYIDSDNIFFASTINQANLTGSLFASDNNTQDENVANIKRITAQVNDFTSEKIVSTVSHEYHPETFAEDDLIRDFVVSNDEQNIYLISTTSEWISFDGDIFTDNGLLEPSTDVVTLNLAKTTNGRPHFFRFDPTLGLGFYVDVYDEQQTIAAKIFTGGGQARDITISNDDKRLIVSTTNQAIEFVTLTQFEPSSTNLTFDTTLGDSSVVSQDVTITGIGENWQASTNVPWLSVVIDTSSQPNKLTASIDTSTITTWGLYTGSITVYDPVSGTTSVISVELAIDAVRLTSNYPALAFNQLATKQNLSQAIDVIVNSEANIAWQASSNVNWLTLTPNINNNTLTLVADPSQVVAGMSYGEVTLSAVNANDALSGTITVSIYKATNDASLVTINNIVPNADGIVVDPLRPYVYFAIGDTVNIYHIMTGALINTVTSPLAGVDLTNLVIHPDGSILLASNSETYTDADGNEQTRVNHYQIDLNNQTISQLDSDVISIDYRPIKIIMVEGMPVVVTQVLELANLTLARQYWDTDNLYLTSLVTSASSTNNLMALKAATNSLEQYQLSYNAYTKETISSIATSSYVNALFAQGVSNVVMSNNGENIYTANTASEWSTFDGTTYTDQGVLQTVNTLATFDIAKDNADNSYFYRLDPPFDFTLTKYNNVQTEINSQIIPTGTTNGQSFIVPDYQRIIIYDNDTKNLSIETIQ